MRLGRRLLALAALTALAACGTTAEVHSQRADPIGVSVPNSEPDTSAPTDSTPSTDAPDTTTASGSDTLDWGKCDDPSAQDPALQCATLKVPLDYDNPTGDSIDMALVKVPATGDRTGAVLFNPGGPGGSGFDFIGFSGTGLSSTLGIESMDLIGFDPRGVDRSGGIRCVSDQFEDQHLYIDDTPDTPEDQTLEDEAHNGFIDGCKAKYGDTLKFYSTVNTARDMDAIRAALGDDKISYLGVSYGTYLGATYATMFPDRVRAMVLDSVVEPKGDTEEQEFATQLQGFEGAFDNWAKWCQDTATCKFTATDVSARWDALRQRLDDTSISGKDGRVANNATMLRATTAALYSESDWPVLAEALAQADQGDPTGIFSLADGYNGRNDDGTFNTLFQSFPVISCASGISTPRPADPDALAATIQADAPRFAKGTTGADLSADADTCEKLVGNVQPIDISYTGDGPIVLVGGANDPATPIRWTKKMLGELGSKARMVTYTGEGHGQLLSSTCVADIEGALLAKLTQPDPDTTCGVDPVIDKPDWWSSLPVPTGLSDVVDLPAVAAVLAAPTQFFSEIRTTALDPDAVVAEYTDGLNGTDFQKVDIPSSLPIDHVVQGAYSDGTSKALIVLAIGPEAFDDPALQSAKSEVPPNTTVVLLIAVTS